MSRDHRKLQAFEMADDLAIRIYHATQNFPDDERFGLRSQIRRSAVSVPTNIVEGCARQSNADYRHFMTIAHASLRELGYLIDLATRLGFIPNAEFSKLNEQYDHTARILANLIKSLKSNT